MTVEVCAELTGTLNSVIEVNLVTEDFSAVGRKYTWPSCVVLLRLFVVLCCLALSF